MVGYLSLLKKVLNMPDSSPNDRGCVYGVLIEDGRALIIRRSFEEHHYRGRWELPGGKLEEGEDYVTALLREFGEEVGLGVRTVRPLRSYTFPLDGRTVRKEVYLVERESGIVAPRDHIAHAWAVPEDFSRYDFVPNTRDDIRAGLSAGLLVPSAALAV